MNHLLINRIHEGSIFHITEPIYYEILKKKRVLMKEAVLSRKKRNLLKFAKKVLSKRRKRIYNGLSKIQKFIGKNRRKREQSKLEKKTHLPSRFLRLRFSSAFSLFGRVMKTLVSQRLSKYVINYLLLCSARRD